MFPTLRGAIPKINKDAKSAATRINRVDGKLF